MEGQTTQAIRKKGKWKDRQYKPSERKINGRTGNATAIRKKSKWKDKQHNGHQKERQTTQAIRKKDKKTNNGLQNNKQKT